MANNKLILEMLDYVSTNGDSTTVAAGFDAVIDSIVRMVKKNNGLEDKRYFGTIEEFGKYLITKRKMSCSIEMEKQQEKIGGNMAIFSNAFGTLGTSVQCIGSMGDIEVYPLFREMSDNCNLHTICKYGQCTALEFKDGKVMLYSMDELKELTWENICKKLGKNTAVKYFRDSDLVALLNWSELFNSTKLFRDVSANSIETVTDKKRWVLLDLSDASKRTEREILEIIKLGEEIGKYRTVVFSMNENECRLVYRALFHEEGLERSEMGKRISKQLNIDYLIIHLSDCAYGYMKEQEVREEGYFTSAPVISTGGGDNFNAGLCFGLLHGLALPESLKLGNSVSGYYVRTGKSPNIQQLYGFLTQESKEKGEYIV